MNDSEHFVVRTSDLGTEAVYLADRLGVRKFSLSSTFEIYSSPLRTDVGKRKSQARRSTIISCSVQGSLYKSCSSYLPVQAVGAVGAAV